MRIIAVVAATTVQPWWRRRWLAGRLGWGCCGKGCHRSTPRRPPRGPFAPLIKFKCIYLTTAAHTAVPLMKLWSTALCALPFPVRQPPSRFSIPPQRSPERSGDVELLPRRATGLDEPEPSIDLSILSKLINYEGACCNARGEKKLHRSRVIAGEVRWDGRVGR